METLLELSMRELKRGNHDRALELVEASNRFADLVDRFFPRAAPHVPCEAMLSVLTLQAHVEAHIDQLIGLLPNDPELIEMRGLLLLREPMVPLGTMLN